MASRRPILIQSENDIIVFLEKNYGTADGDYFVLNQQATKDSRTGDQFITVFVQTKNNKHENVLFQLI
jgi:hypothetical protein